MKTHSKDKAGAGKESPKSKSRAPKGVEEPALSPSLMSPSPQEEQAAKALDAQFVRKVFQSTGIDLSDVKLQLDPSLETQGKAGAAEPGLIRLAPNMAKNRRILAHEAVHEIHFMSPEERAQRRKKKPQENSAPETADAQEPSATGEALDTKASQAPAEKAKQVDLETEAEAGAAAILSGQEIEIQGQGSGILYGESNEFEGEKTQGEETEEKEAKKSKLPEGVNIQAKGMKVLVRRSWLCTFQPFSEGALQGSSQELGLAIFHAMQEAGKFKWAEEEDLKEAASTLVLDLPKGQDEDVILDVHYGDVIGVIGLPDDVKTEWLFTGTKATLVINIEKYKEVVHLVDGDHYIFENLSFYREAIDKLDEKTGGRLIVDKDASAQRFMSASPQFPRESGKVWLLYLEEEHLKLIAGEENWEAFLVSQKNLPKGKAEEAKKKEEPDPNGLVFSETMSPEEQEEAKKFLASMGMSEDQAKARSGNQVVNTELLVEWRKIQSSPFRNTLIEMILNGNSEEGKEPEEGVFFNAKKLNVFIANAESSIARNKLSMMKSDSLSTDIKRSLIDFLEEDELEADPNSSPVEGVIVNDSGLLVYDEEASFHFDWKNPGSLIDTDLLTIRWTVTHKKDTEIMASGVTNQCFGEADPFFVKLHEANDVDEHIYTIHAEATHYPTPAGLALQPAYFHIQVQAKSEDEQIAALEKEAFNGMGDYEPEGKFMGSEDILCSLKGRLPADFEFMSINQRRQWVETEIQAAYEITFYNKEPEVVEAVERRIKMLNELRQGLDAALNAGDRAFELRGTFLTVDDTGSDRALKLQALASFSGENENWKVVIHDLTEMTEPGLKTFVGKSSGRENFAVALREAAEKLAKDYPLGRLSILAERVGVDKAGNLIPTGKTIGYRINAKGTMKALERAVYDESVQIVVNLAATATMVLAPITVPILLPLITSYNVGEKALRAKDAYDSGRLEDQSVGLLGETLADLLPVLGRASAFTNGMGETLWYLDVGGYVLDGCILYDQVKKQLDSLSDGVISSLTQDVKRKLVLQEEIKRIESTNLADPKLEDLKNELKEIEERLNDASKRIEENEGAAFAALTKQGLVMVGQNAVLRRLADVNLKQEPTGPLNPIKELSPDATPLEIQAAVLSNLAPHHGALKVVVNPDVPAHSVAVKYDAINGRVKSDSIYIEVGTNPALNSVEVHGEVIDTLKDYSGMLGELRILRDQLASTLEGTAELKTGERSAELKAEIAKHEELAARIEQKIGEMGAHGPEDLAALKAEREAIHEELNDYREAYLSSHDSEGLGEIAVGKGLGKKAEQNNAEALNLGFAEPLEGHYWVKQNGEFKHVRQEGHSGDSWKARRNDEGKQPKVGESDAEGHVVTSEKDRFVKRERSEDNRKVNTVGEALDMLFTKNNGNNSEAGGDGGAEFESFITLLQDRGALEKGEPRAVAESILKDLFGEESGKAIEGRSLRQVRHAIKEKYKPDFYKTIGVDYTVNNIWGASRGEVKASDMEIGEARKQLQEVLKHQGLGNGDKGSIGENWYKAHELKAESAKGAVESELTVMNDEVGNVMSQDKRILDHVVQEGDKLHIHEVKTTDKALDGDKRKQIMDQLALVGQRYTKGENDEDIFTFESLTVAFLDPEGGRKNKSFMAELFAEANGKPVTIKVSESEDINSINDVIARFGPLE